MDALETLVREALAEHAHEAPGTGVLTVPAGPARRRWPHALLAAAVVAAVAAGIVVVRGGSPSSGPAFMIIPPGTNEVSYHGVTIEVPDNLPIGPDALCSRAGVWTEDPQSIPHCPSVVTPSGTAPGLRVILEPLTFNISKPDNISRRDLRGPGVSVLVWGGARALHSRILSSIRITPIDRNGCMATLPVLDNPPADKLLPGRPSTASECIYTTELRSSHPAFLLRSLPVDPDRLPRLVAAIRDLPAGSSGQPGELPGRVRYQFTYPDGSTRSIDVLRGGDPTVTDGVHVAHDPDNSIAQAFD